MLELYWGCFIGGALFVLVTIIFGDVIGSALDGMLDFLSSDSSNVFNPLTLVGGLTVFGGTGILLESYSSLPQLYSFIIATLIALLISILLYFFYVKPMSRAESSIGYSLQELVGQVGEVSISIPSSGYGEVIFSLGMGVIHHTAASFEQDHMAVGSKVVVVEVKEGVMLVVPFQLEY